MSSQPRKGHYSVKLTIYDKCYLEQGDDEGCSDIQVEERLTARAGSKASIGSNRDQQESQDNGYNSSRNYTQPAGDMLANRGLLVHSKTLNLYSEPGRYCNYNEFRLIV